MEIGTYVTIIGLGLFGRIINIRVDDRNEPIFTVRTRRLYFHSDGLYVARRNEIREA